MKKGCLIRLIIMSTIFVAIALFYLQQKFDNIFDLPKQEFVLQNLRNEIDKKLDFVKDSPQKINLEKIVDNAKTGLGFIKDLPTDQINNIRDKFDEIFSDSIITQKELNYVRQLFKKLKK